MLVAEGSIYYSFQVHLSYPHHCQMYKECDLLSIVSDVVAFIGALLSCIVCN